jgi:hypothetical protein
VWVGSWRKLSDAANRQTGVVRRQVTCGSDTTPLFHGSYSCCQVTLLFEAAADQGDEGRHGLGGEQDLYEGGKG